MVDQSFKGFTSEPRHIDVEKGQLKFFAHATGETNPIYFDEAAARAAGHPALPAPPTFTFRLALVAPPTKGNLLGDRSEEQTYELQSLMRTSYAVFSSKKKNQKNTTEYEPNTTVPTTSLPH